MKAIFTSAQLGNPRDSNVSRQGFLGVICGLRLTKGSERQYSPYSHQPSSFLLAATESSDLTDTKKMDSREIERFRKICIQEVVSGATYVYKAP